MATADEPSRSLDRNPLWDLVIKLVGATAAGVGILGFVTLVGGATAYARFSSAALPAEEIVANLPRNLLLVLGAKALTVYAAFSACAVAWLFVWERQILAGGWGASGEERRVAGAQLLGRRHKHSFRKAKTLYRFRLWSTFVGAVLGIVSHVLLKGGVSGASPFVAAATAMVMFVGCMAIAGHASFVAFALTAVLVSGLFGTVSAVVRINADPTVRPVALVRTKGEPISGIFITAAGDRILVGQLCTSPGAPNGDAGTGSVVAVPREEVTEIDVGNNVGVSQAIERAKTMLQALTGSGRGTTKSKACTSSLADELPRTNSSGPLKWSSVMDAPGRRPPRLGTP